MTYICDKFCTHENRIIADGDCVHCSICEKPFHKDCFKKHNENKHNGKAEPGEVKVNIVMPKTIHLKKP